MKYGRAIGIGLALGLVLVLAVTVSGCVPRPLEAYCMNFSAYPCSAGHWTFHGGIY